MEAGAAKVDITAPVGTPLNGYGARMGRDSTGIHDPIWSRALYLDDGQTRLFLVSVDLVAINPELRQLVLEMAPKTVPLENIILTATHTHSGQGAMTRSIPIRFVSGRFMPEVLHATASGIADSMRNAYDNRRRAAAGYGTGTHEGLSVNRRYPDGPVDNQVGVILVEDADGMPISLVTHFTAHPTSVGNPDLYSFSADYPGYYYSEIEELLGPECVPIFLNGALGNQTIGNPDNRSGWERTESIGRRLARKAHDIAQSITFSDVSLTLSQAHASLPRTIAPVLQPERVLLQSLEINELLLSFFPGEPCVELALNLRQHALARGYKAHFSVGLSNDYLMYFVPRHLYADLTYESSMNFFGPGIEDWFYDQFRYLMTRSLMDETEEALEISPEPHLEDIPGGIVITLSGTPHSIGAARGDTFVADIHERYEQRVVQPVEQGLWTPSSGLWAYTPPFLDMSALTLPLLAMGSRELLKGLSLDFIRELEGMAEGARLPFDSLWLLQNAPLYAGLEDKSLLFAAPLCTMFALTGDRAGPHEILVGRNLDWSLPESGVVTRVAPDVGHAFVQAGFSWNGGVYTAMNDAGLTISMERLWPETAALPSRAPVEFMLRDIIQRVETFQDAVELVKSLAYVDNTLVMVAGYDAGTPRAALISLGEEPSVRYDEEGVLLGVEPANPAAPATTRKRYSQLSAFLEEHASPDLDEVEQFITGYGRPASEDPGHVWNVQTRHSTVLLPKTREVRVAFPLDSGIAGNFTSIAVSGE